MSERTHLLVIDDDRKIAQAVEARLRAVGYEVQTAYDGEAGLEAARTKAPDAIVLDLRMPKLDGFSVLAKLREQERTKQIPVIVLSASAIDQGKALDVGAFCFLPKPYDPQALLSSITLALQERRAARNPVGKTASSQTTP